MNQQEIISCVEAYLRDDDAKYAIMIDGPWGSGKTYFYKNMLLDKISVSETGKNKAKSNVYISLYGISSIEVLSKQLTAECILYSKFQDDSLAKKICKKSHGIHSVISKSVSLSVQALSVKLDELGDGLLELFDISQVVICFDDFERCTIPVNEVLGFINNLVEHCDCKVIILADERSIGRIFANTNIEAKYQTILSGRTIIGKEKTQKTHIFQEKPDPKQKNPNGITIKEIKELNEELYSENYLYMDVKEKVIGKTFFYYPELKELIQSIIDNKYKDKKNQFRSFLIDNISRIASEFQEKGNRNLRIVKCWMDLFQRLFEYTSRMYGNNQFFNDIVNEFLPYSIWVACAEARNKDILRHSENDASVLVYFEDSIFNRIHAYRFIDEWIRKQVWDEKEIGRVCRSIIERKKSDSINNPKKKLSRGKALNNLGSWRILTDDEVENNIKLLVEELKDNMYEFGDFHWIISFVIYLSRIGFKAPNPFDVQKEMISLIRKTKEFSYYDDLIYLDFATEDDKALFYRIYNPILEAMKDQSKKIGIKIANDDAAYLDGKAFCENCIRMEEYYIRHRSFMEYIDLQKLVRLIGDSDLEGLYKIGEGIKKVYYMGNVKEFYETDTAKLSELYILLSNDKSVDYNGITRRIAIDSIKNEIASVLSLLGVNAEDLVDQKQIEN